MKDSYYLFVKSDFLCGTVGRLVLHLRFVWTRTGTWCHVCFSSCFEIPSGRILRTCFFILIRRQVLRFYHRCVCFIDTKKLVWSNLRGHSVGPKELLTNWTTQDWKLWKYTMSHHSESNQGHSDICNPLQSDRGSIQCLKIAETYNVSPLGIEPRTLWYL